MTEKTKKIIIGVASAVVLICLLLRYPAMRDQVALQFGLSGRVTRSIGKPVFAGIVAVLLLGGNLYANLFCKDGKISGKLVFAFVLISAFFLLSIFI